MNDQQAKNQCSGVRDQETRDQEIRSALDRHWAASNANDFETEHLIYHDDAILGIIGGGDLWVTELILTYDGKPSYTVSIMEFKGDKVARERQYFADPFVAPAFRARWVERMDA
ncbi:MAG TPA: hypothetical protein VMF66_08575 [Candidatus Acidoferrum sp.]|nr:hypothetical protein [Candidatus Acidoferrum sp.]